jgi:hypothetical protein
MKNRGTDTAYQTDDRRRSVRATLVGSALVVRRGKNERVVTAVLDNANRIGAGLHAKEALDVNEPVTVSFAFLDQKKVEQQEKLAGTIAWVKPWITSPPKMVNPSSASSVVVDVMMVRGRFALMARSSNSLM